MVDTPSPKPDTGAASTPFKRGQIVWSRPPQTVFRVAQPPRLAAPAVPAAPVPAPRARSGGGILNGSMIPRAAPAATREALPAAPTATAAVQAVPTPAETVAPLPGVAPAAAAAPEPSDLDIEAVPAPAVESEGSVPSYADTARAKSGVPPVAWIGGAVALAVVAGVAWLALRPQADAPAAVTTPTATESVAPPLAAPVAAVPVPEAEPVAAETDPTPAPSDPAAEPAVAAASPAPTRPAATAASASPAPRPAAAPTVPQIETAPLAVAPVVPPPTAAEAPATDPDAPIRTRPQSLD